MNKKENRVRLNLTVDRNILEFAKEFSKVSGKSLSKLFDDYFENLSHFILTDGMSAYEFYHNQYLNPQMRQKNETKERILELKKEALDHKEAELKKVSPDSETLKLINHLLKSLEKNVEAGEKRDWEDWESFQRRWEDLFE